MLLIGAVCVMAQVFMKYARCVAVLVPIKTLYWAAVLNGVVAVPVLAMMVTVGAAPRIMGELATASDLMAQLAGRY